MLKYTLPFLIAFNVFADCKREEFGYGTETRQAVLTERSQTAVVKNKRGTVKYGKWTVQYTGNTFEGNPFPALEIDHIIPIHYAKINGACNWTQKKKIQFGTDFYNLAISDKNDNLEKGSNICWRPKVEICDYLLTQKDILYKYELPEPKCLNRDIELNNC